jgi:hypothetical protein
MYALRNREKRIQRKKCFIALGDQENKNASARFLSAYEALFMTD